MEKSGQLKISFGMIFSIIMIIIFLTFAFYAIRIFLGIQEKATVGLFLDDFQDDVDSIWKSIEGSQVKEYNLPQKIEYVCFIDGDSPGTEKEIGFFNSLKITLLDENNIAFYPVGSSGIESGEIRNIDIGEITLTENPFCIENKGGKVKLTLIKETGEAQVKIERA
jgi:hypothetical protein